MRRTNNFAAHPRHDWQKACLCEWLAASCAFYNEINHRRRQAHFDRDDWREATTTIFYDEYAPLVGTGTAQQLIRKNARRGSRSRNSTHIPTSTLAFLATGATARTATRYAVSSGTISTRSNGMRTTVQSRYRSARRLTRDTISLGVGIE